MAKCAALVADSSLMSALPVVPSSSSTFTLFCDFDGPIVDVSDRYYSTYLQGLAEVEAIYAIQGIQLTSSALSKEQFWQMKQERTPDREIAMRSGLQGEQISLFLDQVCLIVNQPTLLHQDRLQPGVRWALSLLHAQGVRLVLVTLRQQTQATQFLQQYGLEHLFSGIYGAQDDSVAYANHAQHKVHLLEKAIAECAPELTNPSTYFSSASSTAWMIGDTEADILAGQAAGIPTIALTCGIRSRSYLQTFDPTHLLSDLLSAAHYLTRCYTKRLA